MSHLSELSQSVLTLSRAVDRLCEAVRPLGVSSPENQAWYELLNRKLVRQLSKRPYLVVAVMGGTNTGKSVVFNHLAGENASAADPRAAGTKHPVCLVPGNLSGESEENDESIEDILRRHFDTFQIAPWSKPEDPLFESEEHRLFWRTGKNVPARLLLLDTPDIDSDAEVNWERARAVRQTADLMIGVLTEQKYADAAVKRFFREANEAAKPVILLFNMVDLPDDLPEVALWTNQFREETGTEPIEVLIAPHDRSAVGSRNLKFHEFVNRPADEIGEKDEATETEEQPASSPTLGSDVDLSDLLSRLHFETIKEQTLRGALRVICNKDTGMRAYLDAIRRESKTWGEARKTLERAEGIEIDWPSLPTALLIDEIRGWWDEGRPNWSRNIHNTYRKIGNGLIWPFQKGWNYFAGKPTVDPMSDFQKQESETVILVVEKAIERLQQLAKTDNPVLRSSLLELLSGEKRKQLLDHAKAARAALVPIDEDFREFLRNALQKFSEENPKAIKVIRSLDLAAAVARPAITVTLAATGFFVVGSLAGHFAVEAAIAGGMTGGGDLLVNQTGEGLKRSIAIFFQSAQIEYAKNRARHFFQWFEREVWGSLTARLAQGERLVDSDPFREAEAALRDVEDAFRKG